MSGIGDGNDGKQQYEAETAGGSSKDNRSPARFATGRPLDAWRPIRHDAWHDARGSRSPLASSRPVR
ncbi:MAG: hypothetical protein EA381_01420 [Planctomycetaceae bacterium]|nr:MAG: hypothetical protein EA381_01420 [Planctomycetaceae bacterium]